MRKILALTVLILLVVPAVSGAITVSQDQSVSPQSERINGLSYDDSSDRVLVTSGNDDDANRVFLYNASDFSVLSSTNPSNFFEFFSAEDIGQIPSSPSEYAVVASAGTSDALIYNLSADSLASSGSFNFLQGASYSINDFNNNRMRACGEYMVFAHPVGDFTIARLFSVDSSLSATFHDSVNVSGSMGRDGLAADCDGDRFAVGTDGEVHVLELDRSTNDLSISGSSSVGLSGAAHAVAWVGDEVWVGTGQGNLSRYSVDPFHQQTENTASSYSSASGLTDAGAGFAVFGTFGGAVEWVDGSLTVQESVTPGGGSQVRVTAASEERQQSLSGHQDNTFRVFSSVVTVPTPSITDIDPVNDTNLFRGEQMPYNFSWIVRNVSGTIDSAMPMTRPDGSGVFEGALANSNDSISPQCDNATCLFWTVRDLQQLGRWEYSVNVANSSALIVNETETRTFRLTTLQDPLISLFEPDNNTVKTGQLTNFTFRIDSNAPGEVELVVDGQVRENYTHNGTGLETFDDRQLTVSEGSHTWYVNLTRDIDGAEFQSPVLSFRVVTDPSVLFNLNHPQEGDIVDDTENFLEVVVDSNIPGDVSVLLDGQTAFSGHHTGSGPETFVQQVQMADGIHSYSARLVNQSDRYVQNVFESIRKNFTFSADAQLDPFVFLDVRRPANGTVTVARPVSFNWTVRSEALTTAELVLDGVVVASRTYDDPEQPENQSATIPIAEGNHTWYVNASTGLNFNVSETRQLTASNETAEFELQSPVDAASVSTAPVTHRFRVYLEQFFQFGENVSTVVLYVNGQQQFERSLSSGDTGWNSFNVQVSGDVLNSGTNSWRVEVRQPLDADDTLIEQSATEVYNFEGEDGEALSFAVSLIADLFGVNGSTAELLLALFIVLLVVGGLLFSGAPGEALAVGIPATMLVLVMVLFYIGLLPDGVMVILAVFAAAAVAYVIAEAVGGG